MPATHDDAMLMVELAKWGAMIGLGEASRIIYSDDFDPESADVRDEGVQAALAFHETIGTLVKNGLIDRDLVLDWLWVAGAWQRVGPAAERARKATGVDAMFENFQALADAQRGG